MWLNLCFQWFIGMLVYVYTLLVYNAHAQSVFYKENGRKNTLYLLHPMLYSRKKILVLEEFWNHDLTFCDRATSV